jgi:poly-gamma-glutamate synthase PgsB/CapB
MQDWILLALASGAAASVIVFWIWQTSSHAARLKRIPIRVHVNGIRGKSTIVRYVAGALRAHGIRTMAKTTGSDTRIIHPDGSEEPIKRRGAPTILEQINVLRRAGGPDLDAIVFECMALRPEYQQISEQRMIRATDGVIANIRQDHVEELGATRVEIAQSLSATTPVAAPLYTSEGDPQIRAILERSAKARGGWLVTVTGEDISREERQSFGPLDFPENIALAVEIANRHGVPRDVALNGIRAARSDPGASKIHRHKLDNRTLIWIDLFGVNDVQSAEMNVRLITDWMHEESELVFVINNRADRQNRSVQFAEMAGRHAETARIVLVGENVGLLSRQIAANNPQALIETPQIPEGARPADINDLINLETSGALVICGLANIHTKDATRLRTALETSKTEWLPEAARQSSA